MLYCVLIYFTLYLFSGLTEDWLGSEALLIFTYILLRLWIMICKVELLITHVHNETITCDVGVKVHITYFNGVTSHKTGNLRCWRPSRLKATNLTLLFWKAGRPCPRCVSCLPARLVSHLLRTLTGWLRPPVLWQQIQWVCSFDQGLRQQKKPDTALRQPVICEGTVVKQKW